MKSLSKIIMLLVLIISFSFLEVVAQEKYPKSKGKVIFRFASPKDEYKEIYKQLTELTGKRRRNRVRVLDILADEINNRIVLPNNLEINFTNDGEGVAHYKIGTNQVVFGYGELLRVMSVIKQDQYREYFANDITQQELILGAATFTILHELHHFLFHNIDKLNIVLTAEEDWADVAAMQFMLSSKNELIKLKVALMGIFEWHQSANDRLQTGALDKAKAEYAIKLGIPVEQVSSLFSSIHHPPTDEHSPNDKRYYDLLSIFIGKYSSARNIWSAFVRKTENEPTFFTQIEKIPFQNPSTQKSDTIIFVIEGLNPKISQQNAEKADYFFSDNVQKWKGFMGHYLKDNQTNLLLKSRSENYRFFKFSVGIAQTAQNSKEFYNSTLQSISKEIGASVYLEPKLNVTNHASIGLKIAPTIITPKNTNSAMSIFLPVMLSSELYLGQRRLRPFIGLSAGGIYSGGWKLNYKNLQTDVTEPFKIPAKITLGVSPRVGLVFGKIRADFEYNWMAGKVQTLAAPSDADVKDGVYFGTGNLEVIPLNRNHFTLRFGIDIGGGKKYKQWRE